MKRTQEYKFTNVTCCVKTRFFFHRIHGFVWDKNKLYCRITHHFFGRGERDVSLCVLSILSHLTELLSSIHHLISHPVCPRRLTPHLFYSINRIYSQTHSMRTFMPINLNYEFEICFIICMRTRVWVL